MAFRIKPIWADALNSDLSEEESGDAILGALRNLLGRTRCLIGDLSPSETERQKKLSLWMLRTAKLSKLTATEFWDIFLRETARWMLVVQGGIGGELCELADDERLAETQLRELSQIRTAWSELDRERIINWAPRKMTRLA